MLYAVVAGWLLFVFMVWLLVRLSGKNGAATAQEILAKRVAAARKERDETETSVYGLSDDDLDGLRRKWTRQ